MGLDINKIILFGTKFYVNKIIFNQFSYIKKINATLVIGHNIYQS